MEKIKEMSIDLETYSDVDIKKSGVYKYAESENFEILLFAVSINGSDVIVYDLACGDVLPDEILDAIVSNDIIKWAFNASFERICLSYWMKRNYPDRFCSYSIPEDIVGNYLDPASWRCTMIWSAYMGLPLSLEGVGAVLGLKDQKMKEGKDLIRYFCAPCKPTKSNGGRTRNFPMHAPEKWAVFKLYNKRDVEVEIGIKEKLHKFPVPDFIWSEYHLDQEINDRGILVDLQMVENAITFDERSKATIADEMRSLTNIDNPNSVSQMKSWLSEQGVEAESLGKKAIAEMIKDAPEDLAQVLSLRQQLAKSSVKKYQAMQNAACIDHRTRGMFQFYGANRTGRWAGRLIQLQNLPQNHMNDLDAARELVRIGDYDSFMDDNSDDDTNRSGWEPTDNTSTENSVLSLMMIDDLINEVSLKYPEAKAIFSLLMDDPQISNALKQVDLKKGKSQAYEYVKKMQAYAKELYNKNYR